MGPTPMTDRYGNGSAVEQMPEITFAIVWQKLTQLKREYN